MTKYVMLTISTINLDGGYEKYEIEADTLEEAFEKDRQSSLRMANACRRDAQKYAPERLAMYEILDRPQEYLDSIILLTAREYSFENHYIDLDAVTEDDLTRIRAIAPIVADWVIERRRGDLTSIYFVSK